MNNLAQSIPIADTTQTKCVGCGGIMEYEPEHMKLQCLYCSSTTDLDVTPVEPKEQEYDVWKNIPNEDMETATMETSEVKCKQCGATTSLPQNIVGAKCVFCGTSVLLNDTHIKRFWKPQYILPFTINKKKCETNFYAWIKNKWFLPDELKKGNLKTDAFQGVYLPFWTYDAHVDSEYLGRKGVNRTVTTHNAKGEAKQSMVTDWVPASGNVHLTFDDIVIPGTDSLPRHIIDKLTQWDKNSYVPFRQEFLAGFLTETYHIDFRDGWNAAKKKIDQAVRSAVVSKIGGDAQEIIYIASNYSEKRFKLVLLPVWISTLHFNDKLYQFVINGRTGEVVGKYPRSKKKMLLVAVAILALIAILLMMI